MNHLAILRNMVAIIGLLGSFLFAAANNGPALNLRDGDSRSPGDTVWVHCGTTHTWAPAEMNSQLSPIDYRNSAQPYSYTQQLFTASELYTMGVAPGKIEAI